MSKFYIKKISEINKDKLLKFYKNTFLYKEEILENYYWRYRLNFNSFEPLILLIDDEICGHAGLIPIILKIKNIKKEAIWFTDFFINQEHRTQGYGKLLTEEWMKICPIQITLCNDQSLRVFKKLKWTNNNKFSRKINFNNILKVFPNFKYFKNTDDILKETDNFEIIELNNSAISDLVELNDRKQSEEPLCIYRDESWFRWRLIDCPYKKDIYILKNRDDYFIVHIKIKNKYKILNIIYSSTTITRELQKKISDFSKKNRIHFFAYISNEKKMMDSFMPWDRKLNFAFFSNDSNVVNGINSELNNVQYIDSDLDYID